MHAAGAGGVEVGLPAVAKGRSPILQSVNGTPTGLMKGSRATQRLLRTGRVIRGRREALAVGVLELYAHHPRRRGAVARVLNRMHLRPRKRCHVRVSELARVIAPDQCGRFMSALRSSARACARMKLASCCRERIVLPRAHLTSEGVSCCRKRHDDCPRKERRKTQHRVRHIPTSSSTRGGNFPRRQMRQMQTLPLA